MYVNIVWHTEKDDLPVERRTKLLYVAEHDATVTGYRVGILYYTPLGAIGVNRAVWSELQKPERKVKQ